MKMTKIAERYFEIKFRNSELTTKKYIDNNNKLWYGVWKGDFIIVGLPNEDYPLPGVWFSNGPYFAGGKDLLELNQMDEFYKLMKMFLEKKFPGVKIKTIY